MKKQLAVLLCIASVLVMCAGCGKAAEDEPKTPPRTSEFQLQPGDTLTTWAPEKAEDWPADEDCDDTQLLEKWMAVEGLTYADLDARNCSQLVLVVARKDDGIRTYTSCYDKQADGTWAVNEHLCRMHGWVGDNGINHDRTEGDKTSPAGLWDLGFAFGNSPKPDGLKIDWRDVTEYSDWVGDWQSPYCGTWQERNDPNITQLWDVEDGEHLADYTSAYAYACVIEFNTPPNLTLGRGGAIFFHCSRGSTAGCVALPKTQLVDSLLWMDPACTPCMLITGDQLVEN